MIDGNADPADAGARRAIEAPADDPLVAIVGPAGSGKTETLARRYVALLARDPQLRVDATIVTAPSPAGARALAARIADRLPPERVREWSTARYVGVPLDRLAFDILAEHSALAGLADDIEAIEAYDAEAILERAIAPLFSADWAEYLGPQIDPEISGLRAPDRFAVAVLRLIRKLRAANLSPDRFLSAAFSGATTFYGRPPNLAAPALIAATKDEHRSSLTVDADELDRQRRRELDLAKIIAKVYRSYVVELVGQGCLTSADAIVEAARLLDEQPAVARGLRRRFGLAIVDDAHDLPPPEFRLLAAIFGATHAGMTIAGHPDAATRTFAGVRPDRVFGAAATTFTLQPRALVPAQLAAVARALIDPGGAVPIPGGDAIRLHRAPTPADEVAFIASSVAASLGAGTAPGRIAVVHRSLRALAAIEEALVDRDIPIALLGDGALFARHDTLDALALLWSTVDPFAHDWLLRTLQLPLLSLDDAALAILCGEPPGPQAPLFEFPGGESDATSGWDRRRNLRLATNVVRGDRDGDLAPDARERLTAYRARRRDWQALVRRAGALDAAAAIVRDGGITGARPGETRARTRRRAETVQLLLATLARYADRRPQAELAEALAYCARIARSETGPAFVVARDDAVVVGSVEAIAARRFEEVFVADVRAGSFPPYYVPDAFLFSPTYGMIPKDSAGDAITSRTAKFTWYVQQAKLRESFAREDRRRLALALTRADRRATVTAAGPPTRGVAAPELLAELQALQPPLPLARSVPAAPAAVPTAIAVPDVDVPSGVPPATVPAVSSAGRLAQLVRCVRCVPRHGIAAPLGSSLTLLDGKLPHDDRVVERDTAFAFVLEGTVVFGSAAALLTHDERLVVAVSESADAAALAALTIHGLGARVRADEYFVEFADGTFGGPHPCDPAAVLDAARALLAGRSDPRCAVHPSTD